MWSHVGEGKGEGKRGGRGDSQGVVVRLHLSELDYYIISPPCLASCRRCTTCERKDELSPRRFADCCKPTVQDLTGLLSLNVQASVGIYA